MKRILIFLASAALILSGCAKEIASQDGGELTSVTFTAQMDNDTATKAATDEDGAAASINRCIMEIYYGNELFTRMYAKVTEKKCSFTTNIVSNRTYKVVFWADHVTSTEGEAIATDLYYTTNAEGGLQAISLNGTYAGNDDARDAFFFSDDYKVEQAGSSFSAFLKRPFAQINVITNDWDLAAKNTGLAPEKVTVTLKNPMVNFNALTGEATTAATPANLEYTANVYTSPTSGNDATLSMDYIFGSSTKEVIDIDWKALHGTDATVSHSFAAVPYQRNYRTNIKGALLTTTGQWNVTVDPIWAGELPKEIGIVSNIAALNAALTSSEYNDFVIEYPSDSDTKNVTFPSNKNGGILRLDFTGAAGATNNKICFVNAEGATGPATIFVKALPNTNFDFNLPNTHVELYGADYGYVTGITSKNTLVIAKDASIKNLTLISGGLEVYGKLEDVTIPNDVEVGDILVRECHNLSLDVYEKLKPYCDVDKGYAGVVLNEKGEIVKGELPVIAKIGDEEYYVLQTAFDKVANGETIELSASTTLTSGIHFNRKDISATFDLKGFTLKVTNDTENNHRAIKVLAGTLTVKNGAVDARNINGQGEPAAIIANNFDGIYGAFRAEDGATLNLKDLTVYNNHFFGLSCKYNTGSTGEIDGCTFYSNYGGAVEAAGGVATVKNSTIHQEGVTTDPGYDFIACGVGISTNGTVNLKDVNIEGYQALVTMTSGGTINVDGGTYATNAIDGNVVYCNGSDVQDKNNYVKVKAGNFSGKLTTFQGDHFENSANIELKGGTYNVNPSAFVVPGYKSNSLGGTPEKWEVVEDPDYGKVAKIGETRYTTLADALTAAKANDEITLIADCEITSQITISKNLSFDLNNKKVSFSAAGIRDIVLTEKAEVSFKDGDLAITNADALGLFDVTSGKSLTMTSVNLTGSTKDPDSSTKSGFIFNNGACNVTLTDCTGETNYRIFRGQGTESTLTVTKGIYNCEGYNVAFQDAGTATYDNVTITVNGDGTSDYQSGIYVNGKTATITNCTVNCPKSKKGSVTVCAEGSATINGGTYSGMYAIDVLSSGGEIIISGENTVVNCTDQNNDYGLYVDSRNSGTVNVGTDAQIARIIVNAGTINGNIGTQHKGLVYVHGGTIKGIAKLNGDSTPIEADGGTFSFDPATTDVTGTSTKAVKIADGYISAAQGTTPETWKVIVDPDAGKVAKIGETRYEKFSDAVKAVKANETIILLDDVAIENTYTYDSPLSITKSGVTLDLNSKTISAPVTSAFQVNSSDVTVKNGTINVSAEAIRYSICANGATNLKIKSVTFFGGVNVTNASSTEFTDCNITVTPENYSAIYVQGGSTVTVNSGNYTAAYWNGSCYNLVSGNNHAIVKGGTFYGNPVCFSGSSATITGGSFTFWNTNYWKNSDTGGYGHVTIPEGYTDNHYQNKVNNIMTQFHTITKN